MDYFDFCLVVGADRKKKKFFMKNMFFLGVGDVEYAWRIFFGGGRVNPL